MLRHADGVALACEPLLMEFARPLGVIAENKRAVEFDLHGDRSFHLRRRLHQRAAKLPDVLTGKIGKNIGLLFADALLQQLLVIHGTVSFSVFSYLIIPPSKMQTERSQNL